MSHLLALALLAVDPSVLEQLGAHALRAEAAAKNGSVTVSVVADELDDKGAVVKSKVTRTRVTRKDGRPITRELLEATENGKDITASERKAQQPKEGKGTANIRSPFHPDEQKRYRFTALGSSPAGERIGFAPAAGPDESVMVGEATVSPESGEVLSMVMRPSRNPAFADSLEVRLQFDEHGPAGRALSLIEMKGSGGFLFIRKRFHVVTRLSDYAPLEAAPPAAATK